MTQDIRKEAKLAYKIVADGGGEIVGRTKIQKIGFFLETLGIGSEFNFSYKHYGPFSDDLGMALRYARIFDFISEEERPTAWGGFYSIYRVNGDVPEPSSQRRAEAINLGKEADPVELELAATAAYLALEGIPEPWLETERRKPDKATRARLRSAKQLYARFRALDVDDRLPAIA